MCLWKYRVFKFDPIARTFKNIEHLLNNNCDLKSKSANFGILNDESELFVYIKSSIIPHKSIIHDIVRLLTFD